MLKGAVFCCPHWIVEPMQSWLRVRQNGTGGADDGRLDYIAAVVLDSDMTMRFGAVRLLAFELLLPPTRFSTRFVSASEQLTTVHQEWPKERGGPGDPRPHDTLQG